MIVYVVLPQCPDTLELGPPLGVYTSIEVVETKFVDRDWKYTPSLKKWVGKRRSDGAEVHVYEEVVAY